MVAVPPTRVTVPVELAPAVVVEATLVRITLFPAAVKTKLPFVAVMFPRVAVRVVALAMLPGAINVAGIDQVMVDPDPVVVIWFAVPSSFMFPAEGLIAPPLSAVSVAIAVPLFAPQDADAVPPKVEMEVRTYSTFEEVLIHLFPIGKLMSDEVGALKERKGTAKSLLDTPFATV